MLILISTAYFFVAPTRLHTESKTNRNFQTADVRAGQLGW